MGIFYDQLTFNIYFKSGQEQTKEDFSSDEETAQEKKLRLTKKYLEQIANEGIFLFIICMH